MMKSGGWSAMLFDAWSEAVPGFQPGLDLESLAHRERLALVDCNQFYVSCERLFRPELRRVPVVVLSNNDGCVIARSLEAREMGIEMGVPWFQVRARYGVHAPIAFSSNYTLYEALSERVMASLRSFGHGLEVYSIDEAFVQLPSEQPWEIQAEALSTRVERWTGIPVGVGIGSTKSLAKVASWLAKRRYKRPWYALQDMAELAEVPVDALWGIGPRHAIRLRERSVKSAADFVQLDPVWVRKQMTVQGLRLYLELQGIVCHPMQANGRRRRQIRHARSLARDESCLRRLKTWLAGFVAQAAVKLRGQDCIAGKLGVYLISNRFRQEGGYEQSPQVFINSRLEPASSYTPDLLKAAHRLLEQLYRPGQAYKKIGVLLQDLVPRQEASLNWLWPRPESERVLMTTVDAVNSSLGHQALFYACQLGAGRYSRQENRSPHYLTRWDELPVIAKR